MTILQHKAACGLGFKARALDGVIEGYAATWDRDLGQDRYVKGAFRDVISRDLPANRIKIYREHKAAIGIPTDLHEDDTGLWVEAKIVPGDSVDGDETLNLAKASVYDAFSVGWKADPSAVTFVTEGGQRTRVISRVAMLAHVGVLADPMNPAALVHGVKGQGVLFDTEKKSLHALAEALMHLAIAEEIRRWAELDEDEAAIAQQVLDQMAAASEEIKARLPARPAGDNAMLEAARQLKALTQGDGYHA